MFEKPNATDFLDVATLTSTLNSTVISYQPSLVIFTEYATSTAVFTATLPDQSASIVYLDPSTAYVTLNPSTVVVTLQQPVVTITPEPVTQVSTLDIQTSIFVSGIDLTETIYATLPQETTYFTTDPSTDQITVTLPRDTTTVFISVTPPALTETISLQVTLPAETQTLVQSLTLPAETQTIEVTQTLPDVTETLAVTETLVNTQYGPTITQTYSPSASAAAFVVRIVGGSYDGNYLYTAPSPYDETATVITIGSEAVEAAAIFSIDGSGFLSTSSATYAIQSGGQDRSLIVSSNQYTLPMSCADVNEGFLFCYGDVYTVFSAEGYAYLETNDYYKNQSPSYADVRYQILYLPLADAAVAASTSSTSAAATPTSVCNTAYRDTSVTPAENYSISCTVDYYAANIVRMVTDTLVACIQYCSSNAQCAASVWVQQGQDQQWCYLKDANTVAQPATFPDNDIAYSATRSDI